MAATQKIRYKGVLQKHEVDWFGEDEESEYQILGFINQRLENRDYYKRGLEKRWLRTIACYEGFYRYRYDSALRQFMDDIELAPWRKNLMINLALPIVRSGVAKQLKDRPIWDVVPDSQEIEDINRASAGRGFAQAFWYRYNLNYEFIDLLLWLALTGNAYIGVGWNPDIGPKHTLNPMDFIPPELMQRIGTPEEVAVVMMQAQQQFAQYVAKAGTDKLPLGDPELRIITPFDMLYPYSDRFSRAPWVIETQIRDISYYAERDYDVSEFDTPTQKEMRFIYYTRRINNLFNLSFGPDQLDSDSLGGDDKDILEIKLWLPQSPKLPDGYLCVVAGGKIIQRGKNPFDHRQIPIVHFSEQKTPSKVIGFSKLEQSLSLIEEYSRSRSQVVETQNLMSKPKVLAPRSAMLLDTAWTSAPGEVVEFTGTVAPTVWVPPPIPRYVFDTMLLHRKDIDDIVAQRDATKGYNPPGVRSALALDNLQAADEGEGAITSLGLDTGFAHLGRLLLSTADQYIKEYRRFTYPGERGRLETIELNRGTLRGPFQSPDYFNVRVTMYSQLGMSRYGQLEFLKTLLQFNIFTPSDRPKILKFISMGYFEDELDEFKEDRNNAHLENIQMEQGLPVMIMYADHHATHLEEHKKYMKGKWRQLSPQAKQLFVMHVRLTELMVTADIVKPEVLALKARLMLGQQEGVLPLMFGEPNSGTGKPSSTGKSASSSGSQHGSPPKTPS